MPGWAIGVMGAGVVSVGGGGRLPGSVVARAGAAGVDGGSSWGRLASDRMGVCGLSGALGASVCGLSGALGASDSGRNGMGVVSSVWRGVYRRRKRRFHVVRRPDPSVLTEYWWYYRTSTTVPVLSHLVGWCPVWYAGEEVTGGSAEEACCW